MYAVLIYVCCITIYIFASKCGIVFWQKFSELYLKFNKMNVWNKILGDFSSFLKQSGNVCIYNIFTL